MDTQSKKLDSQIEIIRESEFYQGFIRLKMSVLNKISFVITDVDLDFRFDENMLRIERYEPSSYQSKNGKIILGNIDADRSKSITILFDPLLCSRGTDINCQVTYKDVQGKFVSTFMEPKLISVVCPILNTDQDINIGRLKEFIEKLPNRDSKIYKIQYGFDINKLTSIARNVLEKHDVRHIRTLETKDGREWEIWYYGKTKVKKAEIVIKVSIFSEKQSLELFAATESAEALTGLLAEFGRDLKSSIESRLSDRSNVINVTIRDSVIQRSNLLDFCSMDGTCPINILVEDSVIKDSSLISERNESKEDSYKVEELRQIFDNNPDEASIYAEKRLSSHYSEDSIPVFTNGFRMIYELYKYCHSSHIVKDELLCKLNSLQSNFEKVPEIADKRINPLLNNGIKVLTILDEDNISEFESRYLLLCDSLVEELLIEVVGTELKANEVSSSTKIPFPKNLNTGSMKENEDKTTDEGEHREETGRKASGELEIKKRETSANSQAAKPITKPPSLQKVFLEKTDSSFGKKILVYSLIFGVLLIGSAVSFFGLNEGSGDSSQEIQPVSVTPSENIGESGSEATASPAQTSLSQNSDTYTNPMGMEFVEIPAGEFMMGAYGSSGNEVPVHEVTINKSFYLGKFEVTQEQWQEVMGSNPSEFEGDDNPVDSVTWVDAQDFIEKLNKMEDTDKYRLPSEAEWEYACRAGTTTTYYFGDDESKLGDYAWYDNISGHTHPVGQKKPNSWGLYDMYGNVGEWVQDTYHTSYEGAPSNGSFWEDKDKSDLTRVIRGGDWYFFACRSASRSGHGLRKSSNCIGFRVMMEI